MGIIFLFFFNCSNSFWQPILALDFKREGLFACLYMILQKIENVKTEGIWIFSSMVIKYINMKKKSCAIPSQYHKDW